MTGSSGASGTTCPSWCQLPSGGTAHLGTAGGITHRRITGEIRLAGTGAIRSTASHSATVAVEAYTDPEGRQHAPTVRLALPDDECTDDLTPAEARELAAALLEAARLAGS